MDLLASFAALLGKEVPSNQAEDSRDYLATLLGTDTKGPEVILEQARGVAIRRGTWKYVEQSQELYDLSTDPSEKKNLAGSFPAIAEELNALLKMYKTQSLSKPGS